MLYEYIELDIRLDIGEGDSEGSPSIVIRFLPPGLSTAGSLGATLPIAAGKDVTTWLEQRADVQQEIERGPAVLLGHKRNNSRDYRGWYRRVDL